MSLAGRCRAASLADVGIARRSPARRRGSLTARPRRPEEDRRGQGAIPQVALINEQVRQHWEAEQDRPFAAGHRWRMVPPGVSRRAGPHPDGRRVEAIRQDEPAHDRKARLVDRLLGDDYVEEYARNWTTLWTNLLIGRSGGTERRTLVNREGLQQSLRRAFQRNMPYDKLVFELISATGVSKPGEEGFNGFVNFLAGNLEENGVQATAKTSQIFLGLQVQCTQCHNHPFNDWKQNQFWEMNAFFRQTRAAAAVRKGPRRGRRSSWSTRISPARTIKPGRGGAVLRTAQRLSKAAYPVFVDGTEADERQRLRATRSIAATSWPS